MSLNYQDVVTADLSSLLDVSDAWKNMSDRFGELAEHYKDHVQGALANGNWQGLASGAQQKTSKATAFEYAAAKKEAQSVSNLLREAHSELTKLQKSVKELVVEAEGKGYKVDMSGKATYVGDEKLTPKERYASQHDPDYSEALALAKERSHEWTKEITAAVKAVDDADENARRALERAARDVSADGTGFGGFNARDVGNLKKAGAEDLGGSKKSDGRKEWDHKLKIAGWDLVEKGYASGPELGFTAIGPKYGKEGTMKAYADLFHFNSEFSMKKGGMNLTGVNDFYGGGRSTANVGFTDKGLVAKAEASLGVRLLIERRLEKGGRSVYGRAEGFGGGEASLGGEVGPDGLTTGGKVFAGGKFAVAGGVESNGIEVGGTHEWRYGVGAEFTPTLGKGEDGKYHIGGKVGAAVGLGASTGFEFSVDPGKVGAAASNTADAVGDAGRSVKNTVTGWF